MLIQGTITVMGCQIGSFCEEYYNPHHWPELIKLQGWKDKSCPLTTDSEHVHIGRILVFQFSLGMMSIQWVGIVSTKIERQVFSATTFFLTFHASSGNSQVDGLLYLISHLEKLADLIVTVLFYKRARPELG